MGFFGGGGGGDSGGGSDALNQQIAQNQAELEQKRQKLYKDRLSIIKSQGAETWTPDRSSPIGATNNASNTFDPYKNYKSF